MEQNKAIQILVEAVEVAQKRGAYSLAEVDAILPAVKAFIKQESKTETKVEEKCEEKVEEVKEA